MASKSTSYIPILNTNDSHYRYKMPKLIAKVEGSGNGIKTVIPNMATIAKALNRPPSYPIKYFGYEIGAQVRCDKPPYSVNGAHDADELQKMLYSFIEKFVLCSKCKNPETRLKVKSKTIFQSCFACGHEATIPDTHKFTKFIINHPPEEDTSSYSSSKQTISKKEKISKKKSGSHSPTSSEEKKSDVDDDFDEIGHDELIKMVNDLQGIRLQPPNNDTKESLNSFCKMIADRKDRLNDTNVHTELLNEATRLGVREMATLGLSETLFTDNICEEIQTYHSLLTLFCEGNKEAQKYLLGGFEKLVGEMHKDKLLNKVQTILYMFYDCDLIEEETFIEWSEKVSDKYVSKDVSKLIHEKASPFIKWLKETPDSDNDDDDGFDIEYSHRVSGLVVEQAKTNNVTQDDTDDINIDEI